MLTKGVMQMMIKTFTEVLKVQKVEADRMETLEKFDRLFGMSIPGWEQQFVETLREDTGTEEAIKSVEEFISKYHVYSEDGSLQFERIRVGNGYHSLTIIYDSSAPEGQQFRVEETPDIESMSIEDLRAYYEELESALSELEDEEPDEDSEDYEKWEDEFSDIESLMEDIEERIEELNGSSN